jgi:hypothetical protein
MQLLGARLHDLETSGADDVQRGIDLARPDRDLPCCESPELRMRSQSVPGRLVPVPKQ